MDKHREQYCTTTNTSAAWKCICLWREKKQTKKKKVQQAHFSLQQVGGNLSVHLGAIFICSSLPAQSSMRACMLLLPYRRCAHTDNSKHTRTRVSKHVVAFLFSCSKKWSKAQIKPPSLNPWWRRAQYLGVSAEWNVEGTKGADHTSLGIMHGCEAGSASCLRKHLHVERRIKPATLRPIDNTTTRKYVFFFFSCKLRSALS